jgi:lipoate-protein ligase A
MIERVEEPAQHAAAAAGRGWNLEVVRGAAGDLHAEPVEPTRTVRVCRVNGDALVLGSAQAAPAAPLPAGVELVRRRSGGGAVWLSDGGQVWVDVVIPARDPLWQQDVGRSALWLGEAWARCIGGQAEVCVGPPLRRELGSVACFAGLGPGEVSVDGAKVVGISQRRTRELARFQSVAYLAWDPAGLIDAMDLPEEAVAVLMAGVSPVGMTAGGSPGGEWGVVERLLDALP